MIETESTRTESLLPFCCTLSEPPQATSLASDPAAGPQSPAVPLLRDKNPLSTAPVRLARSGSRCQLPLFWGTICPDISSGRLTERFADQQPEQRPARYRAGRTVHRNKRLSPW